jgi:hypothetical protein
MSRAPAWFEDLLGAEEPVQLSPRGRGIAVLLTFGGGRALTVAVAPGLPERAAGWVGSRCHADVKSAEGLDEDSVAALLAHVGRAAEERWLELRTGATGSGHIGYLQGVARGESPAEEPRSLDTPAAAACAAVAAGRSGDDEALTEAMRILEGEFDLPDGVAVHLEEAAGAPGEAVKRRVDNTRGRLARARCLLRLGQPERVAEAVGRIWGRGTSLETRREAARILVAAGSGPAAEHALRHNAAAGLAVDRAALAAFLDGGPPPPTGPPPPWSDVAGHLLRWLGGTEDARLPAAEPLDSHLEELVDAFVETGRVCLRGALDADALGAWIGACRAAASANPGGAIDLEDADVDPEAVLRFRVGNPDTWIPGRVVMRAPVGLDMPTAAPRLYSLVGALVGGVDRLSDAELPMRVVVQWPRAADGDGPLTTLPWHIDDPDPAMGPDRRDFGLLMIVLLRDAEAEDGATVLDPSSAPRVAAMLDAGTRIDTVDPAWGRSFVELSETASATGKAGDIWLLHPWTLHSPGLNRRRSLRLFANPGIFLRRSLRLRGEDLSPVEAFAARGLGAR